MEAGLKSMEMHHTLILCSTCCQTQPGAHRLPVRQPALQQWQRLQVTKTTHLCTQIAPFPFMCRHIEPDLHRSMFARHLRSCLQAHLRQHPMGSMSVPDTSIWPSALAAGLCTCGHFATAGVSPGGCRTAPPPDSPVSSIAPRSVHGAAGGGDGGLRACPAAAWTLTARTPGSPKSSRERSRQGRQTPAPKP